MSTIYTINNQDFKFETDFSRDPEQSFLDAVNKANPDLLSDIKPGDVTLESIIEVTDNAIYNTKLTLKGKSEGRYTDSIDIFYNRIKVSDVLLALDPTGEQFAIVNKGDGDAFQVKAIDPYDIYKFNHGITPKYSDLLEYLQRYWYFNIGKVTSLLTTEITDTVNDTDVVGIALAPDNIVFNGSGGSESNTSYNKTIYFENWKDKV